MKDNLELLSRDTVIQSLEKELTEAAGDFDEIAKIFNRHTKSSFVNEFVVSQLKKIAADPDYVVTNIARQWQVILINTGLFDYTLQLRTPVVMNQSNIKWMGIRQIISVKGKGSLRAKVLKVPGHININKFQSGILLEETEEVELKNGDSLLSKSPYSIIDIVEVKGTVLVESLSVKDKSTDFFWTFDNDSKSFMAEASSLLVSRLTTVLNLTRNMKLNVSDTLYRTIFTHGDANLKLSTIQTMLIEGNHEAFDYLLEAIDSADDTFSSGAQRILDRLTTAQQSERLCP